MRQVLSDEDFFHQLTELLLAEGISRLTVAELASRLHCSRRRLYEIAEAKEELFLVVARRMFDGVLREAETVIQKEADPTLTFAAYLNVGVRAAARISAAFLNDVEASPQGRALFDDYQQARAQRLCRLIDDGVEQGIFVPCHGEVVSEMILGAAMRLRRPKFLAQAHLTIEEAFDEFYKVLLNGILSKRTQGTPTKLPRATAAGKIRISRSNAVPAVDLDGGQGDSGQADVFDRLISAWNRD